MALTMIGCSFCLMHMRAAALRVTALATAPMIVFFLAQEQTSLRVTAINLALVSLAMTLVLFTYYRDLANLVQSRKSLTAKQAETHRLSDENFRIANLDSLTDLPNHRRFFASLDKSFERHAQRQTRFAIGTVDLDGFKPINDTYGHRVGDAVLLEVGRRLEQICGEMALVHRLGDDEFGVNVGTLDHDGDLLALGRRITEFLKAPQKFRPDANVARLFDRLRRLSRRRRRSLAAL
jgi:diguanylate cyclase (GGDEF)-like protein